MKHIESDSLLAYFFLAFGKEDFFVRAYRVFSRQQADCVTKQRNGYEAILTHYFMDQLLGIGDSSTYIHSFRNHFG